MGNKQTKNAAAVEQGLGITDLFGTNAIGNAGGLPEWLQDIQTATAGAHQQEFLEALFPRANALQAMRWLTGENFQSAQERISQTGQYAGTVAAGASIADAGPQAQFQQIGAQFNKDVIEIGDTLAKTLNPDLLKMASGLENVTGKLGDLLGASGSLIDKWSAEFDLPKKAGDLGSWLDQNVPGGKGTVLAAPVLPAAVAKGIYDHLGEALTLGTDTGAGPGVGEGYRLGASDPMRIAPGSHTFSSTLLPGQVADPTINLPGGGAHFYLPTATGGVAQATGGVGAGLGTADSPSAAVSLAPVFTILGTAAQHVTASLTSLGSGAAHLVGNTWANMGGLSDSEIAANQARAYAVLHPAHHPEAGHRITTPGIGEAFSDTFVPTHLNWGFGTGGNLGAPVAPSPTALMNRQIQDYQNQATMDQLNGNLSGLTAVQN
ncbi:MAG: hypothetical protein ACRDIE_19940, partial [Chloroflexota bacterium]